MSDPTINTETSLQILRQTYTDKVLKADSEAGQERAEADLPHSDAESDQ